MKRLARTISPSLLLATLLLSLAFGPATNSSSVEARGAAPVDHVVVLVIDGVRWHEVFHGTDPRLLSSAHPQGDAQDLPTGLSARELLPNMHQLAEAGVLLGRDAEAPILASGPNFVSLPGYRELLTGATSAECQSNDCKRPTALTLVGEFARNRQQAAVIASWSGVGQAVPAEENASELDVGAKLSRNANKAESFPGHGDYRPDKHTMPIALSHLQQEHPAFLLIALGDTDEYAHRGDYLSYLYSLRAADAFIGDVAAALSDFRKRGRRATLIVTTDHGRAEDFRQHGGFAPESSRVWLLAAGDGIVQRGNVRSPVPRRLADVAPTVRQLAGLQARSGRSRGLVLHELLN